MCSKLLRKNLQDQVHVLCAQFSQSATCQRGQPKRSFDVVLPHSAVVLGCISQVWLM